MQRLKTRVIENNVNPEWNEDLDLTIHDPDIPVQLTVYDQDNFSKDDNMGDSEIDIRPFLEALKTNKKKLPSGTVLKKLQPSRSNLLADKSRIKWKRDKIIQDMCLKLKNVECGEYNQLERRLSIQEKSFSDLQLSVSALNSTKLQLKKSIDEDLKAGLNVLIANYQSRIKLDTNLESSFVTGGSPDRSYVEVVDDQSSSKLVVIHLRGEALLRHQAYIKEVDVLPDVLPDLYLRSLPAELLHTIHLFDPKTVNQEIRLARLQECAYYALWGLDVPKSQSFHNDSSGYEKNRSLFSPSPSALPSPKFLPSVSQSQSTSASKKPYTPTTFPKPYIKPSNPSTNNTFTKNTPFKPLSKCEYDEKRMNNQCFSCNEKYSPGHVCKNGKLYMILSPEFVDVEEVDASTGSESSYRDESTEGHDSLALSIHALLGSWGLQTL
nr:hypothetical protein [Tanacetum cinerariifolium]